jgi:hypothetical protein
MLKLITSLYSSQDFLLISSSQTNILKSTIFWDITPCSLLSVNRRFGATYRLHLQGRPWRCLPPAFTLILAQLLFRSWRCRRYFLPKHRLTLNGLHGVISQKMALFKTTAVRTSNPTDTYTFSKSKAHQCFLAPSEAFGSDRRPRFIPSRCTTFQPNIRRLDILQW